MGITVAPLCTTLELAALCPARPAVKAALAGNAASCRSEAEPMWLCMHDAQRTVMIQTGNSDGPLSPWPNRQRSARCCSSVRMALALNAAPLAVSDWRMLDAYPAQYVARRLAPSESIAVDGRLDEDAWQSVAWTDGLVDITRHTDEQHDAVPADLQARVKIRWDADYFYVGAELRENYVDAALVGHNAHAPYSPDNDFEVFIDVSGTTQYYVEFEMSLQNATYDIKWGKPDQTSLLCDASGTGAGWPALPTCVNTSFGGYAGNWTMASKLHPGPTVGLSHTTPALMNATLTPASRGTTAWRAAAEEP